MVPIYLRVKISAGGNRFASFTSLLSISLYFRGKLASCCVTTLVLLVHKYLSLSLAHVQWKASLTEVWAGGPPSVGRQGRAARPQVRRTVTVHNACIRGGLAGDS